MTTAQQHTRIKICGITRPEDAQAAVAAGADAIGFVLWPGSKRHVVETRVAGIVAALPAAILKVGVFVDATVDDIRSAVTETGITAAQLCGTLPDGPWDELARELSLWRSLPVSHGVGPTRRREFFGDYLFDTPGETTPGGTGRTFDWNAIGPARDWGRTWVAGGLHPGNVGDTIATVRPHGVDVSTGVEDAPGIKNHNTIREFCEAVRQADKQLIEAAR